MAVFYHLITLKKLQKKNAIIRAKRAKSEVVLHGRDGRIRSKDSYGNDPIPPRDKEY